MKDLGVKETQKAIKLIKDSFENTLSEKLDLIRVSAPLFVTVESGLNDHLSGEEKPVIFKLGNYDVNLEIVQSLAKWKRMALKRYDFDIYEGIYTDMNAIRPDEILDSTHSIYVDQWDWEKIIKKEDRNLDYLKNIVKSIYDGFLEIQDFLEEVYPNRFSKKLPEEIKFISSQELEDLYPDLSISERENKISEKYKAVFIHGIGHKLKSGISHGSRSPDYDDWDLNGDIIFWNPVSKSAIEMSSMGIRVDEKSLKNQLELAGKRNKEAPEYHKDLFEGKLPYTIGGGIGQSRICMFFLEKEHIGQVQASFWTDEIKEENKKKGIDLL